MFFNTKTLLALAATVATVSAQVIEPPANERGNFANQFTPEPTPAPVTPAPTPCDTSETFTCPDGVTVVTKTLPDCVFADCPTPDSDLTTDPTSNVKGDPHFLTFGDERYDYHGQCDLVLVKNPLFKDNMGMEIHIRTKITDWWSSVEAAAIKLGDEVLEVNAGDLDEWLWINGKANEKMEEKKYYTAWINGMQVRYRRSGVVREANIYLEGRPERLRMRTYKDFVRVDVDWKANPAHYKGALGLLGSFDLGGNRVGRDGKTHIGSHNAFGQEWQVREDEPKLFHNYEGVVTAPTQCVLPEFASKQEKRNMLRKRRLANGLSQEAVEKACAHLKNVDERKGCEYDVIATQDIDMASVY